MCSNYFAKSIRDLGWITIASLTNFKYLGSGKHFLGFQPVIMSETLGLFLCQNHY